MSTQWEVKLFVFGKPLPKGWEPIGYVGTNVVARRRLRWWRR